MNEAVVSDLLKDPRLNGGSSTAIDKAQTILARTSLLGGQVWSDLKTGGGTSDI